MNQAIHLTGLTQGELTAFVEEMNEPAYRGRQIFAALHHRRLRSFDEMTDLPKDFRTKLNERARSSTLTIMSDPRGLHIVPNRVTVSTAGIVPRIRELATIEDRPHLAISLAAPTNELRDELMPINKRWPLEELLAACKEFERSLKPGERFTFEYVMLDRVNDSDEDARRLARLLNRHSLRAKVNLIPHNPADELPYRPSSEERGAAFKAVLESKGVRAFVRRPRGRDIYAACGQLAARRVEAGARPS